MSTKIIKTTVIIDCGATGNFINHNLITLAEFPLQHLKQPVKAYNGTTNSKGNIEWEADIPIQFPTHKENVKLMVLSLRWKEIILGMPWLWKWNPQVDWIANTLTIHRSLQIRDVVPLHECLPLMNDFVIPQRYLLWWLGLDANQKILNRLWKREQWLARETVGKFTISTQIVQNACHDETTLLNWCKEFEDVFSEKTHNKLPPHQPYDHTINLQPTFTPKIAKVYSLNHQKMETCKAFIKEHLETGHIIPSKSP